MDLTFPPDETLIAFGVRDEFAAECENRGQVWISKNFVLKPVSDCMESEWSCELLESLASSPDFRVAGPIRTRSGEWIANGYTCQSRLTGEHDMNRWSELLSAAAAFHGALESVPEPKWMAQSQAFFQRCDRFAWEDEELFVDQRSLRTIARLRALAGSVNASNQAIHGDLAGNVLFEPGKPPGIIDFTPYWRPAAYAAAIVVVDAIAVHNAAPNRLIEDHLELVDGRQTLLRAAIFRGAVYGQEQFYDYYFAGFRSFTEGLLDRIE